jgi:hypothetical protein
MDHQKIRLGLPLNPIIGPMLMNYPVASFRESPTGLMFADPSKGPKRKRKSKPLSIGVAKTHFKSLPTSLWQREEKNFPLWKRGIEGDLVSSKPNKTY